MDILFLARSMSGQEDLDCAIEDVLQQARAMRSKDIVPNVFLENESKGLMVVSSLIVTIAFPSWSDPSRQYLAR